MIDARFALSLVFMACVGGTGCAGPGLFDRPAAGLESVGTFTRPSLAPQAALDTIVIGKSSKADVSTTLGKAIVIAFDSGHEVWVYAGPAPKERRVPRPNWWCCLSPRGWWRRCACGRAINRSRRTGYRKPAHDPLIG